jgi:hypothetical protein
MENRGRIVDYEQGKRHSLAETHFSRRLIMEKTLKDKVAGAGHVVADVAKNAGHKIAEGTEKAIDKVEQVSPPMPRGKPGRGNDELCTAATSAGIAGIKVHMNVIASCGKNVGVVDAVEGGAIKLTKKDSPDDQHHFIPIGWVERVDSHVHLNKNSMETEQNWKSDAAACVCSA